MALHDCLLSSGRGLPSTSLNVGKDYPDPARFTVVIWGENRANFSTPPEDLYAAKDICVTGALQTYQGVPEVVVSFPSAIKIVS